ncbi:MAG: L-serine ammonia-lyase [Verrucomicrobiales bacterium]|nr:L-serine ammonia-lyase [Verrucomicrobiales bacterium]
MAQSILDFFTIGIGPSSSHTVGPMLAASRFVRGLSALPVNRLRCDLYGSLAATGKGHGTDRAILMGFLGAEPDSVDPESIDACIEKIRSRKEIALPGGGTVAFHEKEDIVFHRNVSLPRHPNGMHFIALGGDDSILKEEIVYSIGGGFIVPEGQWDAMDEEDDIKIPWPFDTAKALLTLTAETGKSIAELVLENEASFRSEAETRAQLGEIWEAMKDCVERGCRGEGTLPGGLKVPRRAGVMRRRLEGSKADPDDSLACLDWVNLFALAVNEENAAGGRVVTAPTNGAAGIIPAVLHYAERFTVSPHSDPVDRFLLTAGAIATLYKKNASLSGADVGCQGEVGVACSMAAGGLVEWLGGTPQQVECAAEIGMEHNLGLTCDPVGGLVQIPCIERNAMGSVKAINAARLAMNGDGKHIVSLDKVIATMRETGRDMMSKYKETSRGGLAVNVTEC